jgi:hippurate hydrolase
MQGLVRVAVACTTLAALQAAVAGDVTHDVAAQEPGLEALYRDLHAHPELAFHETRTAALLADRLRAAGYRVTTGVGGTGVVGVLENGAGPVAMLRTELDALPIEEKTGLPFASHERASNGQGVTVPVAHACGHDLHMAGWVGTAQWMAAHRDRWRGTLVLVGQPAEEETRGAQAMVADGLLTRFPRPDYALGVHDDPGLPAGQVGFHPGAFRASRDTVEIVVHGRGGHAAKPQNAVDPIVIAARTVLALQTIVSREVDPLSPAVVTVTEVHGGTPASVIPDEARLRVSVRTFDPATRARILDSIRRQAAAEAAAAAAPAPPDVTVTADVEPVENDPELTARLAAALRRALGPEAAREMPVRMTSEDFSVYGHAGIRAVLFHIGAVPPAVLASGGSHPDVHSPQWAPAVEATLPALVAAEIVMLTDLLPGPRR